MKREVAFVVLLSAGLTVLVALFTDAMWPGSAAYERGVDHHYYVQLAQGDPPSEVRMPFGRRLLTPYLSAVLSALTPLSLAWSFRVLILSCVAATGVMIYALSRRFGLGCGASVVAITSFFSVSWAVEFAAYDFYLPDALGLLLISLAILAAVSNQTGIFAALIFAGVLNKESGVFALPLLYTLNATCLVEPRLALRTVLASAPAVAGLLGLRLFIPENHPREYGSYPELFAIFGERLASQFAVAPVGFVLSFTVLTFGAASLFYALCAAKDHATLLLRFAPFVALVYLQPFFAVGQERLLAVAVPAIALCSAAGAKSLSKAFRIPVYALAILPLVVLILNLYQTPLAVIRPGTQALVCLATLGLLFVAGGIGFGQTYGWEKETEESPEPIKN